MPAGAGLRLVAGPVTKQTAGDDKASGQLLPLRASAVPWESGVPWVVPCAGSRRGLTCAAFKQGGAARCVMSALTKTQLGHPST